MTNTAASRFRYALETLRESLQPRPKITLNPEPRRASTSRRIPHPRFQKRENEYEKCG